MERPHSSSCISIRLLERSFERLGLRYACVRHCIHSAADVSDWWEEGGKEEREKMSRGEERGTSGSDVPGCASGSGGGADGGRGEKKRERERKRARKKGEAEKETGVSRESERERKVRAERGMSAIRALVGQRRNE